MIGSEAASLAEVIGDIYDAAIDPSLWVRALESSCRFVGGDKANLFWQDNSAEQVVTLHLFNDDPHFTHLYETVYAPLNPVFPAAIAKDAGVVYAATDIVPLAELVETRFFKEWVAPQGIGDSIGVVLEKDTRGAAFLAFEVSSPVADDAAKQRAALLVPHFQRAVAIGRLFARNEAIEGARMTDVLDHVGEAVFLISGNGRIVFANAAGRRIIDEGKLLHAFGDVLHAVADEAERELSECLHAIADHNGDAVLRGATLALSEQSKTRWIANVLPLIDGARRCAGVTHDAIAAVFVRSTTSVDPTPIETLAKTYKLTASETRVVETMQRISGRDAIGDVLGISQATVKTHLNNIFRKCGVNTQSELVRLVAGIR